MSASADRRPLIEEQQLLEMRRCAVGTQRPVAGLQLGSLNLGDASMCGARAMQANSPSTALLV